MTLTARDVAEITRLLEASSFNELYLELDGLRLTLRRGGSASMSPAPGSAGSPGTAGAASAMASPVAAASQAPAAAERSTTLPPTAVDPSLQEVTAPLLGTFYRAPKPGAPPFVEVGSVVAEETIIGIIEVMKLMNTVRAGVRGRVTEILGRDGVLVEYGETLMRVGRLPDTEARSQRVEMY